MLAARQMTITLSGAVTPLIERQNITLTCSSGRLPTTQHTWIRKLPGKLTWQQLQNDSVTMATDDVGDSLLVSRVKLVLSAADDGVVYRCLAMNGNVTQASGRYRLRVQCKKHLYQ